MRVRTIPLSLTREQRVLAEDIAEIVQRTARLARLEVTPSEIERLAREFQRILQAFRTLSSAPLEQEEPPSRAGDARLREDEPSPFPAPERLLANAPEPVPDLETGGGFFGVPKTIGGEA